MDDKNQFSKDYVPETGDPYDGQSQPNFDHLCCACFAEGVGLVETNCLEKPERLLGQPLGMYHCPDCGAMIMAGLTHPPICKRCFDANTAFYAEHANLAKDKEKT